MAFWQELVSFGITSLMAIILYKCGTLRFFYLVSKIRGPSLWELVTVHGREFLAQMSTKVCNLCEVYSYQPFGIWTMNGEFIVVLSSADSVSEVYKSRNLKTKTDFLYRAMAYYLCEGSITMRDVEKWKLHRKISSPAFHKAVLESNIDILTKGGENIVNEFNKHSGNSAFDMSYAIDPEVVDVIVRFLTSNRVVIPDTARFASGISSALNLVYNKTTNPVKNWFLERFDQQTKTSKAEAGLMIKQIKSLLEETADEVISDFNSRADNQPRDVYESVLNSASKLNDQLSNEEVFNECITLIGASLDTTKTTTKLAILLLALHQEVQQRVFDELQNIFGSSDHRPTPDDLNKMEYLGMVIKETLRLFPSGPMILRKVLDDTDICGVIVPKGACLLVNIMSLHRNPENFKDPSKFIPERFLPELSENRHPYSYIPFSTGLRNCVGQPQAMMTLKVILSTIFRRYQVFPGEGINNVDDIQIGYHITLDVKNSVVKVVSRV